LDRLLSDLPQKDRDFCKEERRQLSQFIFDSLERLSKDGLGVSRASYGLGEQKAFDLIKSISEEEGLIVSFDGAANMVVTLPGDVRDEPAIYVGSHLDSVPQGGNFDGSAGIVAGLLALIKLRREHSEPPTPVRLILIRGEESAWFGLCYLGSYSLFGHLKQSDLDRPHRSTGEPLKDYMSKAGADIDRICLGEKLIDPALVRAYVELHIEQGPVMVAREVPVGIVTGLRGNTRYNLVRCMGKAGHSGAVPRWLRHDAVLASADLLSRMDEHWRVLLERGVDLVLTAGILSTDPKEHAMTRIPGKCEFSFEFRSQSMDTLEAFDDLLRSEALSVARERGVNFVFPAKDMTKPAEMDPKWIEHLSACCETLDIKFERLPSGAGHDAAVFAYEGIPSAMIFIRNENGSHNPNESMDMEDFLNGADVLFEAITKPIQ
jgi:N-carbamoyl-L-amino-acid hydrolase